MSALSPETIRIAIPSYDGRVSPRFDQAREFHIADIDLRHRQCRELRALVCPQPPYTIVDWLSELGTHGVICSGIHQHHQLQLQQLGIWLIWGVSGEIGSGLDHWLQSDELQSLINELPEERTAVCQAH
ncbi:NifB/NifX family molybdenum-iron cluster-binding protein [uncultured Desulfuromonas sp.]|uniref:NifB/NifX family molybdenum-iron cluster-binding protein n=1 Tax=uncultured Desulfuromonas sp. TaxID=181013 RepID=UPI002AAB46F2|nr:NifB/NifX family molybdenum-iron cluster-binding protein [uncultured Desulfuromonas sp.]